MIGLTGIAGSLMAARLWAFRRGFSNAQSFLVDDHAMQPSLSPEHHTEKWEVAFFRKDHAQTTG
jgi:hypothetical protein